MLELTVTVSGKTTGDLELALQETTRLVVQGYVSGKNSNDSAEFYFDRTGEEEDADEDNELTSACPALYELDPIGEDGAMEANGTIYFFCSEAHRDLFEQAWSNPSGGPFGKGLDTDHIEGTVCDRCGVTLE